MKALARKAGIKYGIIPFFFPYKKQGEYIVSGFFTGEDIIWEDAWWNPSLTEKDLVDSDGKPAINRSEIEPTSDIKISKKTEVIRISHDRMLRKATSILRERGWRTKTKVKLPHGQADIIGWKNREYIIAEVKTSNSLNALIHAIGQLLVYKKQISALAEKVRLTVVLPSEPENFLKSVLTENEIEIMIVKPERDQL